MRTAAVHCAFFAASVQREKFDAAPEALPLLAAAMQASQALAAGAGGVVVGLLVGVPVVAGLPVSTGGTFSGVVGAVTGGAGVAESVGCRFCTLPLPSGVLVPVPPALPRSMGVTTASSLCELMERAASTPIAISNTPPAAAKPITRPLPPPLSRLRPLVIGEGGTAATTGEPIIGAGIGAIIGAAALKSGTCAIAAVPLEPLSE